MIPPLAIYFQHFRSLLSSGSLDLVYLLLPKNSSSLAGRGLVGNSRLSGVDIFTDILLGKIFEKNGFAVEQILVLRKRGGKKKLYETAICVKKA